MIHPGPRVLLVLQVCLALISCQKGGKSELTVSIKDREIYELPVNAFSCTDLTAAERPLEGSVAGPVFLMNRVDLQWSNPSTALTVTAIRIRPAPDMGTSPGQGAPGQGAPGTDPNQPAVPAVPQGECVITGPELVALATGRDPEGQPLNVTIPANSGLRLPADEGLCRLVCPAPQAMQAVVPGQPAAQRPPIRMTLEVIAVDNAENPKPVRVETGFMLIPAQ